MVIHEDHHLNEDIFLLFHKQMLRIVLPVLDKLHNWIVNHCVYLLNVDHSIKVEILDNSKINLKEVSIDH